MADQMTRNRSHTAGQGEDNRSLSRKDDFEKMKMVSYLFASTDQRPPTDRGPALYGMTRKEVGGVAASVSPRGCGHPSEGDG